MGSRTPGISSAAATTRTTLAANGSASTGSSMGAWGKTGSGLGSKRRLRWMIRLSTNTKIAQASGIANTRPGAWVATQSAISGSDMPISPATQPNKAPPAGIN
ncbi:hypothetical protein, partial [Pseudomonas sp. MWU12-2115]|uniref:hypothetical protein n=1 Tax=Pseudomonas sp. MWU12-2115 TaxID=2071713 RepID=UPI001C49A351